MDTTYLKSKMLGTVYSTWNAPYLLTPNNFAYLNAVQHNRLKEKVKALPEGKSSVLVCFFVSMTLYCFNI